MSDLLLTAKGLLFDLDGVFVDSTESVERHWLEFADRYDLDGQALLKRIHGVPHGVTIERELSGRSEGEINDALAHHAKLEEQDAPNDKELPGARQLGRSMPDAGWAVVTSCWKRLAELRANAAGFTLPSTVVAADQITEGKPHPEGYLKGAELLQVPSSECIVFEDAPAGIEAGLAAGARVVALRTTHSDEQLTNATHIVDDLSKVKITFANGNFEIRLS
jgi:mannitol-1-/sugar-/sorbitol-6-phosphatase